MAAEADLSIEDREESALDDVQERLPAQAKDLMDKARTQAKDAREQLRGLVNRKDEESSAAA